MNKLYRSRSQRMIGGVCGGLGEYLNTDPTLIRLLVVLLTLFGGSGVVVYIIAWIVVPEEPETGVNTADQQASADAAEVEDEYEVIEYTTGHDSNAGPAVKETGRTTAPIQSRKRKSAFGIVLVVLGCFFLAENMFHFYLPVDAFWPLILVFLGVYLLLNRRHD